MDRSRLQLVGEVADAIQAEGMSGLLAALPRMIGPGADISGCVADADFCMGDAGSAEEFWGCAVGMAGCIRDAKVDVEPPEPPPVPPEEPPEPPVPPDDPRWPQDPATLALAVLLYQLRRDRGYRPQAKA